MTNGTRGATPASRSSTWDQSWCAVRTAHRGYLAQRVDWHIGFACAGVGMTLGLVQYVVGRESSPRREGIRAPTNVAAARAAKDRRAPSPLSA
jgi:hypothetical protein